MKAYELLADPKNWTKGMYHRFIEAAEKGEYNCNEDLPDDLGQASPVYRNPFNYCHCIQGAIRVCYKDREERGAALEKLYNSTQKEGFYKDGPVAFNDDPSTTHEDVLTLLKELDI